MQKRQECLHVVEGHNILPQMQQASSRHCTFIFMLKDKIIVVRSFHCVSLYKCMQVKVSAFFWGTFLHIIIMVKLLVVQASWLASYCTIAAFVPQLFACTVQQQRALVQ